MHFKTCLLVGYSLPASNAFTGFTTTGQNAGTGKTPGNPDEFNVKQPFDNGWYLYINSSKTITTFYKRVGCREVNKGKVEQVNYTGHAWSVTVASGINAFHFGFSDRFILPLDNNAHGWAFAVRSAEEKVLKCGLKKLQIVCSFGENCNISTLMIRIFII